MENQPETLPASKKFLLTEVKLKGTEVNLA